LKSSSIGTRAGALIFSLIISGCTVSLANDQEDAVARAEAVISFNRPTLTLSSNSTSVANIQISRNDNLCFAVDQYATIRCSDLTVVIPTGPNSTPFQIVPGSCKAPPGKPAERVAELAVNPAAINDWHELFDDRRSIILPMVLSNGTPKELTLDLFCTQHSLP